MKSLIALIALTFINCTFAAFKLEIIPNDGKYAKMQIECEDQSKCDEKLITWINKQEFFKGEWKDDAIGSIVSKTYTEFKSQDTGETQIITDLETGEETTVPIYEQIEVQITKYFHPSNFTVNLVDTTEEEAEKALEAAIAKKIACGEATVKFIAKNNVKKQLSVDQRRTMVSTYSSILDLLKSGSVDIAKVDIQNVTADGTIVTDQDKIDIVNFISECE